MPYLIVQWIHVLGAVAAVGANVTYTVWFMRAARRPESAPYILQTITLIDPSNSSTIGLPTPLTFSWEPRVCGWCTGRMGLYDPLDTHLDHLVRRRLAVAILLWSPVFRRQIRSAETTGTTTNEYKSLNQRQTVWGMTLAMLVVTILYMMVVHPSLWS
jgi:uncharacterized membrane protein